MIRDIIKKVQAAIERFKEKQFYRHCYSNMEAIGYAIFCMCRGAFETKYRGSHCTTCPYFRNTIEDNDESIYPYRKRGVK